MWRLEGAAELAPQTFVQSGMGQTGRRRFDDFEIDLGTGELRRHGRPVPVQRQPARVLARLVAADGALVTRGELQAAVWGDGVHVDFDRGLNYCIRQLRHTLGDEARTPRFIETVARQGYRFVAAVDTVSRLPSPVHRLPSTAYRPPSTAWVARPTRRWRLAAAMVALVVGLAADRLGGGNPAHHEMAVAVMRAVHDVVF